MKIDDNIKHVIFDFDKTIATMNTDWKDWHHGVGEIFRKYEQGFDLDLKGGQIHHFQNDMYDKFGPELKNEVDAFVRRFESENTKSIIPIQKTIDLINELSKEGRSISIWSSNDSETLKKWLGELGIFDKFKIIVSRDIVDFVKPHTSGFVKYFQPMALNPNELILIGDSSFDRDAANNCGIKYIDVSLL